MWNNRTTTFATSFLAGLLVVTVAGAWTVEDRANDELPGRIIDIRHEGTRVAGFIYGEGQAKTYLSIYDSEGQRLSNPGLHPDGRTRGRFPHHRGLFIGWNQIRSDLGSDDLWHLRHDERMALEAIKKQEATPDGVTLELLVHWYSADRDDDLDGLLIAEHRTIQVSRPAGRTQVDQESRMVAQRDLRLRGDLQHAGVHFRADAGVDDEREHTRYLWDPADLPPGPGRVISDELRWVNFRFPLHGNWYSVTQLDPPENRSTELSWRDYGRFGFFFTDDLDKGETRTVRTRLLFDEMEAPGDDDDIRQRAVSDYEAMVN